MRVFALACYDQGNLFSFTVGHSRENEKAGATMERWYMLLKAHDHVLHDKRWSVEVRLDTCRLLIRKMIELGPLKPLPEEKSRTAKP